jgi:hypothetical protein
MPLPHPALKKLLQEAAAAESGNGEGAGCAMDIGFILLKHALVAVTHRGQGRKQRSRNKEKKSLCQAIEKLRSLHSTKLQCQRICYRRHSLLCSKCQTQLLTLTSNNDKN